MLLFWLKASNIKGLLIRHIQNAVGHEADVSNSLATSGALSDGTQQISLHYTSSGDAANVRAKSCAFCLHSPKASQNMVVWMVYKPCGKHTFTLLAPVNTAPEAATRAVAALQPLLHHFPGDMAAMRGSHYLVLGLLPFHAGGAV